MATFRDLTNGNGSLEEHLDLGRGGKLAFVSSWACPYSQRVWIVLGEKYYSFDYYELQLRDTTTGLWIQPSQKPPWLLKYSPLGQVPVLVFSEDETVHSIYESVVCMEFLEEHSRGGVVPDLWPPKDAVKARGRCILHRFDTEFLPAFYNLLLRQDKQGQAQAAEKLREELMWLEKECDGVGPFFLGEAFSLVDAGLIPWFLRLFVLKEYREFELPAECSKLINWYGKVAERDSVQKSLYPPKGEHYENALLSYYRPYAEGRANGTNARRYL
eukprot:jgi/Botrbrau1/10898/Bobra.0025s0072.2